MASRKRGVDSRSDPAQAKLLRTFIDSGQNSDKPDGNSEGFVDGAIVRMKLKNFV